jgi:hypothetical protein
MSHAPHTSESVGTPDQLDQFEERRKSLRVYIRFLATARNIDASGEGFDMNTALETLAGRDFT